MNKIWHLIFFLMMTFIGISAAEAKINIFPQPRYLPPLSFYGDSGKAYRLKDFNADLLMAVVWSRRCGPCISEMKNLNEFAKKTAEKGIKVILISPEKEWKSIDERHTFLKRIGAPDLVSYLDRKANFADGMGMRVTPTVFLVNRNSEEVGQITGSVKWDDSDVLEYMLKFKEEVSEKLNQKKSAKQQQQK